MSRAVAMFDWRAALLTAALSSLGWAYATYHTNDRLDVQRIAALEAKVDSIQHQVDRLVTELLDKK